VHLSQSRPIFPFVAACVAPPRTPASAPNELFAAPPFEVCAWLPQEQEPPEQVQVQEPLELQTSQEQPEQLREAPSAWQERTVPPTPQWPGSNDRVPRSEVQQSVLFALNKC